MSKLAAQLSPAGNTWFLFPFLRDNIKDWKALIAVIADYMTNDNQWFTIKDDGIMFLDGEGEEEFRGMRAEHFRNVNMSQAVERVREIWIVNRAMLISKVNIT